MRKVIFGGANSLDNRLARAGGGMDWLLWSDEVTELMNEFWPRVDTILMGRKTFEVAMASQSEPGKNESQGEDGTVSDEANPYGDIKTFIFSNTLAAGKTSGGAQVVADDAGKFVRQLKQQDGKDICLMGGGDLARSLFEAGVIDEIGLNIHPVLLGSGVPLFYDMSYQIDLELIQCKPMKNGCVYVSYRVIN